MNGLVMFWRLVRVYRCVSLDGASSITYSIVPDAISAGYRRPEPR